MLGSYSVEDLPLPSVSGEMFRALHGLRRVKQLLDISRVALDRVGSGGEVYKVSRIGSGHSFPPLKPTRPTREV